MSQLPFSVRCKVQLIRTGEACAPLIESSLSNEQEEGNKILTKNSRILEREGISFDIALILGSPSEEILNFSREKKWILLLWELAKGTWSKVRESKLTIRVDPLQ